MDERLYRIQRTSDGKWFGRSPRWSEADEGCWRPKAGKYLTRRALHAVLSGRPKSWLNQVKVIVYEIRQKDYNPEDNLSGTDYLEWLEVWKKDPTVRNRAQCLRCKDIIESNHRHDFVRCKCGAIAVDGGKDYFKRTGSPSDFKSMSVSEP